MSAFERSNDRESLPDRRWASSLAREAAAWRGERAAGFGRRVIVSRKGRAVPVVLKPKSTRDVTSAAPRLR